MKPGATTRTLLSAVAAGGMITAPELALAQEAHEHAAPGAHDHSQVLAVPDADAPTLSFEMIPDLSGGWLLSIATQNFTWAPGKADQPHMPGEGHAHVYVDGVKISRIYAPDFYLAPLEEGIRAVEVVLNTNDHMVYAGESGAIAGATHVVLAPPEGMPFPVVSEQLDIAVQDGALVGNQETVRVPLGAGIAMRWNVDEEAEFHLHGYDIEAVIGPDEAVTFLFEANIPGRFPVERHTAAGEAPILFLEVLP